MASGQEEKRDAEQGSPARLQRPAGGISARRLTETDGTEYAFRADGKLLTDRGAPEWHPAPPRVRQVCAQAAGLALYEGRLDFKAALKAAKGG